MVSCKRAGQPAQTAQSQVLSCYLKSITARILVLGDRQVGKSATIVRYTTGRYIQLYHQETSSWLYRRSLPSTELQQNVNKLAELMEQKDVKFSKSDNFLEPDADVDDRNEAPQTPDNQTESDQRKTDKLHERQELLKKLNWANAYVIVYAINDSQSFNKAIKYLNLIANQVNNNYAQYNMCKTLKQRCSSVSSSASSCSSATLATGYSSGFSSSACSNLTGGARPSSNSNHHQQQLLSDENLLLSNTVRNPQRKPILLLANKRDLETCGRQVSTNDGRMLAMRHQALFAEISVAESEKFVDLGLSNLIDQIDSTTLHVAISNKQHQLPSLSRWMPSIEYALSQSSVHLATPVRANLVTSAQVNCSLAKSVKLHSISPIEMNVQLVKSCVGSVQVAKSNQVTSSLFKPMTVTSLMNRNNGKQSNETKMNTHGSNLKILSNSPNSYHAKYETLKSSFKRASMAIVSSKVMSKNVSNSKTCSKSYKKKKSSASSDQDSINELQFYYEPTISEHKTSTDSSNWIRNHIKSFNQRNSNSSHTSADSNSTTGSLDYSLLTKNNQTSGNKFKRTLFKYKNRRKTVAFEAAAIEADTFIDPVSKVSETNDFVPTLDEEPLRRVEKKSEPSLLTCDYNSMRSCSSRSSSSLSTTENNYNIPKILDNSRQHKSSSKNNSNLTMSTLHQNNSTVNLSQAVGAVQSRCAANESSPKQDGPAVAVISAVQATSLKICEPINISQLSTSKPVNNSGKKRFQLVKTVQNRFSNLTGSLHVTSSQPVAKRSCCTTLFKQEPTVPITLKKVNPPVVAFAKTEDIQARSTLLGYCK